MVSKRDRSSLREAYRTQKQSCIKWDTHSVGSVSVTTEKMLTLVLFLSLPLSLLFFSCTSILFFNDFPLHLSHFFHDVSGPHFWYWLGYYILLCQCVLWWWHLRYAVAFSLGSTDTTKELTTTAHDRITGYLSQRIPRLCGFADQNCWQEPILHLVISCKNPNKYWYVCFLIRDLEKCLGKPVCSFFVDGMGTYYAYDFNNIF